MATPRTESLQIELTGWFDAAWAAISVALVLFSPLIGSAIVLLVPGMIALYAIVRAPLLAQVVGRASPLLLLPLFAIASTIWSIEPRYSAYYGTQYLITILLGILLGAGTDRRQLLFGVFAAFAVHGAASFIWGDYVGWGGGRLSGTNVAFAGLMAGKNAAADAAAIGALIGCATMGLALAERRVALLAAAVATVGLQGWILLHAESTGALVCLIIAAALLVALILTRPLTAASRTALFLIAITLFAALIATQELWLKPLTALVLEATHKDEGLTGRAFIWARAQIMIDKNPVLGLGYSAFWIKGNVEAEGIWRFMGIANRSGFNFHNTPREILVHLGIVGLAIYGVVVALLASTTVFRAVRTPDYVAIFFCAYIGYVAARLTVETQGFTPFTHSTVMIAAALASATYRRISTIPPDRRLLSPRG